MSITLRALTIPYPVRAFARAGREAFFMIRYRQIFEQKARAKTISITFELAGQKRVLKVANNSFIGKYLSDDVIKAACGHLLSGKGL